MDIREGVKASLRKGTDEIAVCVKANVKAKAGYEGGYGGSMVHLLPVLVCSDLKRSG
jgi:hypothetical protein